MKLESFVEAVGRTGVIAALFALTVILFVASSLLPFGCCLLDATWGYSYEEVYRLIEGYGESGRHQYVIFSLTLDLVLPLTYVSFLAGLIHRIKTGMPDLLVVLIPAVVGMLDVLENIQIVAMLRAFPNILEMQSNAAAVTTMGKWVAFGGVLLIVIGLAAHTWLNRAK